MNFDVYLEKCYLALTERVVKLEKEVDCQKELIQGLEGKFEYLLKRMNFHSHGEKSERPD